MFAAGARSPTPRGARAGRAARSPRARSTRCARCRRRPPADRATRAALWRAAGIVRSPRGPSAPAVRGAPARAADRPLRARAHREPRRPLRADHPERDPALDHRHVVLTGERAGRVADLDLSTAGAREPGCSGAKPKKLADLSLCRTFLRRAVFGSDGGCDRGGSRENGGCAPQTRDPTEESLRKRAMYQFSRAIYRELAPQIQPPPPGFPATSNHAAVLRACEAVITRLATDRHYFAQARAGRCSATSAATSRCPPRATCTASSPATSASPSSSWPKTRRGLHGVSGAPPQCRATTRKGSACQRTPLPHNGYCPSHQHLADTEDRELAA